MNSASQSFPYHLAVLRERMLDRTHYELAVNYFLEEFAGDVAFVRASEPEQIQHLVAVLNIVVSKRSGAAWRWRTDSYRICENTASFLVTPRRTER